MKKRKKKVVIVGGGFAGVVLVKELMGKAPGFFDITLIDRKDYHLFQPGLIKAAVTFKEPSEIFKAATVGFKDIFSGRAGKGITITQKEVHGVLFDEDKVVLKGRETVDYDYLVIATGGKPDFKNVLSAEKYAMPLKTFEDAIRIKSRLEEVIKTSAKKEEINIVVAGAGSSGCSIAAELITCVKKLAELHGHPKSLLHVRLIEAADSILSEAGSWTREKTHNRLSASGIEILLKSSIVSVEEKSLVLRDGTSMNYDVLIWAAGIKPAYLANCENLSCGSNLRLGSQKNVFALGDVVCAGSPQRSAGKLATVHMAIHEAKYVAKALILLNSALFAPLIFWRKKGILPPYKPDGPKLIISLGDDYGLVDMGIFKIAGKFVTRLKHLVFLNYFSRILPWRKAFEIYERYLSL